jgi:secreted PhoX family phosphatase
VTKTLAVEPGWHSMDPIVWTPWGTILVGEEDTRGLMFEIFINQHDPTVADSVLARPALGAKAHEGNRFDAQGNHYGISENNPGFIYKFVPDRGGDLSSGQLYALKITNPTGDRTGEAEWIPLDRATVRVDAQAAAAAAGATGYNRPEDVEIATSSGNSHDGANTLYVAITSPAGPVDNRVIAIDLNGPFVYDYVRVGLNATAEFEWPYNLALSKSGDLAIAEDPGGSFPSKRKGDDIWIATPGKGPHAPAASVVRFATLTDCSSEPTGIYFDIRGWGLFVNAQHRGGDGLDKAVLITPSAP